MQKITPCLWFDDQAEEAATFYTAIFRNSRIVGTTRYGEAGQEVHGKPPGSVMTVTFELDGQTFTEAVSFQVPCETQEEVDHYWERLSDGGDETAQRCGWLKDRFGVSWQVFPTALMTLLKDPDPKKSQSVMSAMLKMRKIDIEELKRARDV